MVEQVAQRSLVRITYFASPEYTSKVSSGWTGPEETFHINVVHHDGARDTFPEWLLQNTLHKMQKDDSFLEDKSRVNGQLRFLMGENGVLCEIVSGAVYDEKRRKQAGEPVIEHGHKTEKHKVPYRKVLRVKSMPSSRELPPELLETLTEMEYQKVGSDDSFVKKGFGGIT